MNKKTIVIVTVAIFAAIAIGTYVFLRSFKKAAPSGNLSDNTTQSISHFTYKMSGVVYESKVGSITISGELASPDGYKETKNVLFTVSPNTIYKKKLISITEAQIRSGKPYQPATTNITGKLSDLTVNTQVTAVLTAQNLFTVNQAVASEIDYTIYDFPKIEFQK